MKKSIAIILIIISLFFIALLSFRLISPREIDDVSPGITCESKYLEKADVLWIIPDFNNTNISKRVGLSADFGYFRKSLGGQKEKIIETNLGFYLIPKRMKNLKFILNFGLSIFMKKIARNGFL